MQGLKCKTKVNGEWIYNHELNQPLQRPETNEEVMDRLFIQPEVLRAKVRQLRLNERIVIHTHTMSFKEIQDNNWSK